MKITKESWREIVLPLLLCLIAAVTSGLTTIYGGRLTNNALKENIDRQLRTTIALEEARLSAERKYARLEELEKVFYELLIAAEKDKRQGEVGVEYQPILTKIRLKLDFRNPMHKEFFSKLEEKTAVFWNGQQECQLPSASNSASNPFAWPFFVGRSGLADVLAGFLFDERRRVFNLEKITCQPTPLSSTAFSN